MIEWKNEGSLSLVEEARAYSRIALEQFTTYIAKRALELGVLENEMDDVLSATLPVAFAYARSAKCHSEGALLKGISRVAYSKSMQCLRDRAQRETVLCSAPADDCAAADKFLSMTKRTEASANSLVSELVADAFQRLSCKDRDLLEQAYDQRVPIGEIARVRRKARNAIDQALFRAKCKFHKQSLQAAAREGVWLRLSGAAGDEGPFA